MTVVSCPKHIIGEWDALRQGYYCPTCDAGWHIHLMKQYAEALESRAKQAEEVLRKIRARLQEPDDEEDIPLFVFEIVEKALAASTPTEEK